MLTPMKNRILVRRFVKEEKSPGGIYLPSQHVEAPPEGKAIAVGPEVVDIKEGDHLIFTKYSGTVVYLNKEELLLMREDEVLAVAE